MAAGAGYIPPAAVPVACAAPMTRAALLAIRTANALRTDCFYTITDWVQGTTLTGPNQIQIHAVNSNTLNTAVDVFTPFDNVSWPGVYDIDLTGGTMVELADTRGNIVRGTTGTPVGTFPWGLANYTQNLVVDTTMTGWANVVGTVRGNTFRDAVVNLTGASAATTTIVDSEILGGTVTATAAISVISITRCNLSNVTLNRLVGSGNRGFIASDSWITTTTFNAGALNIQDCEIHGSTFTSTAGDRNTVFAQCQVDNFVFTQGRTSTNNTDVFRSCQFSGQSTLTFSPTAVNPGNSQTFLGLSIRALSSLTIGSISSSGSPVNGVEISNGSSVAFGGGATMNNCRFTNSCALTVAGALVNVVVELPGAKTLAAQSNRLANKSFDDTI